MLLTREDIREVVAALGRLEAWLCLLGKFLLIGCALLCLLLTVLILVTLFH